REFHVTGVQTCALPISRCEGGSNMAERCFDVAHLGHVELYTDRCEESLDFFTRVYGLKLAGQEDGSAYLRAWDDYEFHTLKLTEHASTGVGHIAYRVSSPEALE